jgi:TfoX/Sxy family transcriptional regulator of competence genes
MSTAKTFIESVLEKLQPLEITAKPMFGEYGPYHQGKNFALVCDNTLFVKITAAGAAIAGRGPWLALRRRKPGPSNLVGQIE